MSRPIWIMLLFGLFVAVVLMPGKKKAEPVLLETSPGDADTFLTPGFSASRINISDHLHGTWLVVERRKYSGTTNSGFDPCYTEITSDFKPVVKQLPNKKWLVQFAEDDLEKEFQEQSRMTP